MFEIPEFDRSKIAHEFYVILEKYGGDFDKKGIIELLVIEAEAAARLYAWKCVCHNSKYLHNKHLKEINKLMSIIAGCFIQDTEREVEK